MDHLLPFTGRESPIVVPYLLPDDFAYDGGDFDSYPERCGWDFSAWRKNDRTYRYVDVEEWLRTSIKTKEELPAFLQSWLVFGQLSFALDMVIPVGDFTRLLEDDQKRVLTTAKLETYLADFASRFPNPTTDEEKERAWAERRKLKDRYWTSMSSLAIIFEILAGTINHGDPQLREELEKIHFAAGLLSAILSGFMQEVFKIPGEQTPTLRQLRFGPSRLVIRNMCANNWCLHTTNRISVLCTYTMQAYLYALGTSRTTQDHSRCTTAYCYANQTGTNFEAQHLGCTVSDCSNLETPIDKIVQVLQEGLIPLLEVQFRGKEYTDPYLVVRKADGNTPYVAISHVWADGLGNSKANSIPICQLNALLRSLYEIKHDKEMMEKKGAKDDRSMMPFWLDTLCIPVGDEYQSLREFSIQKMHDIYQQAHCALVLDPDFVRMTRRQTPLHEIVCRVFLSGWITRLWTFQEGALPSILYIRAKDGIIDIYPLCKRYIQRHCDDWIRARPVADTLVYDAIPLLSFSMPREEDARVGIDFYKTRELYIEESLMRITWRMTSRPGDETVCFATTLGFDPGPILKIKLPGNDSDSGEAYEAAQLRCQEKRMIAFLKLLPTIPLSILFSRGPRISSVKGYRWAPSTLLQPQTVFFGPSLATLAQTDHYAYLHPKGKGLVAFVASISIPRLDFGNARWQIICKDGTSFRAGNFFDKATGSNEEVENVVIIMPQMSSSNGRDYVTGLLVRPSGEQKRDPKAPMFSFKTIPVAYILSRVFVEPTSLDSSSDHSTDYVVTGASVESKMWLLNTP